MQIQFKVTCQRSERNNGYFTMFFNPSDNEMPSMLLNLPKEFAPCVQGRKYRVTIEPVSE